VESLQDTRERARRSVNDFAVFCCTDSNGRQLRQARLHRELQGFLDQHPRALVELPRDHGKSVQICLRILWELAGEIVLPQESDEPAGTDRALLGAVHAVARG
jgi:hypothetical protein